MIEHLLLGKLCSLQNSQRLTYENIYLTSQYWCTAVYLVLFPIPRPSAISATLCQVWLREWYMPGFCSNHPLLSSSCSASFLVFSVQDALYPIWTVLPRNEMKIRIVAILTVLRVHTFQVSSPAVFLQWLQLLFLICSHRADRSRAGI